MRQRFDSATEKMPMMAKTKKPPAMPPMMPKMPKSSSLGLAKKKRGY